MDNTKVFRQEVEGNEVEVLFGATYDIVKILNEGLSPLTIKFKETEGGNYGAHGFSIYPAQWSQSFNVRTNRVKVGTSGKAIAIILVIAEEGGGGVAGTQVHDSFIATPGQTQFSLSQTPFNPSVTQMFISGVQQTYGLGNDFYVVDQLLFWNNTFILNGETIDVYYWV